MAFSHSRPPSGRGYEVIYTAVPATGNAPFPPAIRSRISPPVPVEAPLKGSTVVGKLCVSAFSDRTALKSFILKKSGLSCVAGANCSITGPSMNAQLSLYAETTLLGLVFVVSFINWNSELSISLPSIMNVPLNIL